MIDFYFWPTPNGWKISIALEEMELPYNIIPVNIGKGEQFRPEFLEISPNNRMPAIVDHDPIGDKKPLPIFESGAILLYLAEKTCRFIPDDVAGRYEVTQWLMWQMANLGPMLGQHGHFFLYAEEKIPYAIERYRTEVLRLFTVLDRRLEGRNHICDDYSIADMACWPWVLTYKSQQIALAEFPNVRRWYDALKERPGLRRGYALGKEAKQKRENVGWDDETRKNLLPQIPQRGE